MGMIGAAMLLAAWRPGLVRRRLIHAGIHATGATVEEADLGMSRARPVIVQKYGGTSSGQR